MKVRDRGILTWELYHQISLGWPNRVCMKVSSALAV